MVVIKFGGRKLEREAVAGLGGGAGTRLAGTAQLYSPRRVCGGGGGWRVDGGVAVEVPNGSECHTTRLVSRDRPCGASRGTTGRRAPCMGIRSACIIQHAPDPPCTRDIRHFHRHITHHCQAPVLFHTPLCAINATSIYRTLPYPPIGLHLVAYVCAAAHDLCAVRRGGAHEAGVRARGGLALRAGHAVHRLRAIEDARVGRVVVADVSGWAEKGGVREQ